MSGMPLLTDACLFLDELLMAASFLKMRNDCMMAEMLFKFYSAPMQHPSPTNLLPSGPANLQFQSYHPKACRQDGTDIKYNSVILNYHRGDKFAGETFTVETFQAYIFVVKLSYPVERSLPVYIYSS